MLNFAPAIRKRPVAQDGMVGWMRGLVNGLQNRVHPFESGTDLKKKERNSLLLLFIFVNCAMAGYVVYVA